MDDEKYPKQISSIQITDIKQIIPIIPGSVHISRSDPAIVDFLTNLGAGLFSQTVNSRNASLRLQSISNLSTGKSFTANELDSTIIENVSAEQNGIKRETVHLRGITNAPAAISVPSHRFQIIPKSTEKKIINQKYLDNKATLLREKRFKVSREMDEQRHEKMQRAMRKASLRNALSLRINKEQKLVEDVSNKRLLWISKGKPSQVSKVPIIIVGGGIAGLSAANQLLIYGFSNVTVLEASKRLGGRINTVYLKELSTVLEMGVKGIEVPAENKEIYKWALNNELLKGCYKEPSFSCRFAGDTTSHLSSRAIRFAKLIDKDMKLVNTMLSEATGGASINLSYDSYVAERCGRMSKDNPGLTESETDLLSCVSEYSIYTIGDNVGDSAIQWFGGHIMKKNIILPIGFNSVVKALTNKIKTSNIRLNSQVKLIEWNALHRGSAGNIQVTCTNGQIWSAAHVIVAVPLGHLKENAHAMFVPPLPATKLNAIQKVGFGTVSKVFLIYNLPLDSTPISVVCSKNISTFGSTVYIRSVSPNVLEMTSVGSSVESMTDQNIIEEVTRIMREDYGSEFPEPHIVYKSAWFGDPLYRGSHTYLTTQCERKHLRDLSDPVTSKSGMPLLLFAGDYSNEHLSCLVEAAYCSGVREAQRINNFYDEYFGYENINE